MNIVVAYDGSDDAYAGLKLAAQVLQGGGARHHVTVTVVGWPPRSSPLWDKAFGAHGTFDDLHRAVAQVADVELKRLRELFAPLGEVESHYAEGDPAVQIGDQTEQRCQKDCGRSVGHHDEADARLRDPEIAGQHRQHWIDQGGAAHERDAGAERDRQRRPAEVGKADALPLRAGCSLIHSCEA